MTGLRWQKCTNGKYGEGCTFGVYEYDTWLNALEYCENLRIGASDFKNRENWRLPNINELKSIVDRSASAPTVYKEFFPNTMADIYWSSTTSNNGVGQAIWQSAAIVNFKNGAVWDWFKIKKGYIRCVAGDE